MTEKILAMEMIDRIEKSLRLFDNNIRVSEGLRLPYSGEILSYKNGEPSKQNYNKYEIDILIFEQLNNQEWKPRVILEIMIKPRANDLIASNQKAFMHKNIHPCLRCGTLIAHRKYHLPDRLFRHDQYFDFVLSWETFEANREEWTTLIDILKSEYEASVALEEILFNDDSQGKIRYKSIHKMLKLNK
jgi:hypothetical protein